MNVRLISLKKEYYLQFVEMMDEWKKDIVNNKERATPIVIFKDYSNFDEYIEKLNIKKEENGYVPASTYFLLDLDNNKLIGACNIRHYLNDYLLNYGGHIGDGIRPSYRNKGYGTILVKLALIKCRQLNINKVLMVANENNIASIKTILRNGGIFESSIKEGNEVFNRYWINL